MAFFDFTYDSSVKQSEQGQLSSGYTDTLAALLAGSEQLADYVAWLFYTQSGASVAEALALRDAVLDGDFALSGLFGAAQSKTGAVAGSAVNDPVPTLTAGDRTVDLTAMLDELDTHTWTTTTKKETIFHTREFFTDTQEPAGYDPDWDEQDTPPELTLYEDEHTFTFTDTSPAGDPNQSYDLLGTGWQNVKLVVTGTGDYNKPAGDENVTLTGDVGNPAPDPFANPAAGPSNPEGADNYVGLGSTELSPTAAQYADGSIDLSAAFSSQVHGGTFQVVLTYEYYA